MFLTLPFLASAHLRVSLRRQAARLSTMAVLLAACDGGSSTGPDGPHGQEASLAATATTVPSAEFYIHAHQDDWELFMGDRVYDSMQSADKVVLVYTTAGDANRGKTYWQTRERASQAAVDTILGAGSWTCGASTVLTHSIRRCTKGKVVGYYLRVSDGNHTDGTGYGKGSLKLLRDSGTPLTALDGSTTYTSWSDFVATVGAIVDLESNNGSAPSVRVHAPDHSRTLNPGDHPDHWATADAVKDAASSHNWSLAWYVDYDTKNRSVNLSDQRHTIKQREFLAYDNVMVAAGYGSLASKTDYKAWLWRTYFRIEEPPTVPTVPPGPLAAPSNLTATAVSGSQINLSWTDNATNETGYQVERAPDNGGVPGDFTRIANLGANTTSFSNTKLSAGTRYWYRVRAISSDAKSAFSNTASATTPAPLAAPGPLAAPSNLTATANRRSSIDYLALGWIPGSAATVDFWRGSAGVASSISNSGSYTDNTWQ